MEQKLTLETIRKAVEKVRKNMPTFPELDKAIANGAKIEDLFLVIPDCLILERVLYTKHGPLAVLSSEYVDQCYLVNNPYNQLMKGVPDPWKNSPLV